MADDIQSANGKLTDQTASKAIRTEKDNAAGSNANRKPKNMCKSYSKRQISNSKIFHINFNVQRGCP